MTYYLRVKLHRIFNAPFFLRLFEEIYDNVFIVINQRDICAGLLKISLTFAIGYLPAD